MSLPLLFRAAALPLATALSAGLAACQYLPNTDRVFDRITPYKVEVVQGNVVTSEQAEAVKAGMNRAQVRDVLGSPLIVDAFHVDRWDYVFTIRRPGAEPQSRRVVVNFDGDVFKNIETGGALPSERDFVASIDSFKTSRNAPPLELSPEQIKALPVPAQPAVVTAEPIGPTRPYPPLEPNL